MSQFTSMPPADDAPFLIENGRSDVMPNGHFTPSARVVVTATLRTSGLLRALPDRDAKSLLLMLTFLTPTGEIAPTTSQIAAALRLPEAVVRSRMGKLASFRWQGERIVRHGFRESGLDGYRVSRSVVVEREDPEISPVGVLSPGRTYSGSDAVLAFSRAAYGRPRAEVEEAVARQLGVTGQENTVVAGSDGSDVGEARRRLIGLGVSPAQVDRLLAQNPASRILEQIDWLPDRAARSPARFVVRAIDGNYDPPPRIRLECAVAAEEASQRHKRSADEEGEV